MEANDARREAVESWYICGSVGMRLYPMLRDRLFTAPTVGGIDRCPECGLHWLNPRLRPEHIGLALDPPRHLFLFDAGTVITCAE